MPVQFKDQKDYDFVWRNSGLHTETTEDAKVSTVKVSMEDALSHPDAPYFFPITVENYVREAVEPLLIGAKLLTRINYKAGTQITFPSVGAMYAADIEEGMEYPERTLNFGTGYKIATIGKSGLAIKLTEEMKRYSQFDVVGMHLRAAGRAMARHKEQKIFNMLSKVGITTHDNINPSASVFGNTGGRSLSGAGNGAIIADNIYEAYGQLMMEGFTPDILLVHPLTFTIFATDPLLRAFALERGGGAWFNGPAGIMNKDPWSLGALGKLGASGGTTGTHPGALAGNYTPNNQYSQNLMEGLKLPEYLGLPLKVVVSPFIPYNPASRLTNIILGDSSNLGALIVDEEPVMDTVEDKLRDLTKIKIRERYTVHPLSEGKGVATIKNVKVTQNQLITPVMGMASTITAIARDTQILHDDGTIH